MLSGWKSLSIQFFLCSSTIGSRNNSDSTRPGLQCEWVNVGRLGQCIVVVWQAFPQARRKGLLAFFPKTVGRQTMVHHCTVAALWLAGATGAMCPLVEKMATIFFLTMQCALYIVKTAGPTNNFHYGDTLQYLYLLNFNMKRQQRIFVNKTPCLLA